jgi:cellulose synthase/poly-beta-1,6-N-acetylglucosamine synthase-like glycosyltransferase
MNRGADAAAGEILVFSDANNRYGRGTVRALVAPFADPSVGVVGGRKAIDDGHGRPLDRAEGAYWRYEARLKQWENATGSVPGVPGEIVAFRRESYQRPRPGTMNDDSVQAMMAALAGWRIAYAHDAVSLERASATLAGEATRRSRLTTGRWQALWQLLPALAVRRPGFAWRLVSHKGLRPLVPFCLAAIAVSSAVLAASHGWALALVVVQAAFYATAGLGWAVERRGGPSRLFYLPYYFCRMNLATLEGFRNFVRRRHEAVWAKVERA